MRKLIFIIIILFLTQNHLICSTINWIKRYRLPVSYVQKFDHNNNNLYVSCNEGIWKSTNDGLSWCDMLHTSIRFVKLFGNKIYAGGRGISISTDDGTSWNVSRIDNNDATCILIKDNYVFAGSDGAGVYYSTDSGKVFSRTSLINMFVYCLAENEGTIFAGTAANGIVDNQLRNKLDSDTIKFLCYFSLC